MTELLWALVAVVAVLAGVVTTALAWAVKLLRRLSTLASTPVVQAVPAQRTGPAAVASNGHRAPAESSAPALVGPPSRTPTGDAVVSPTRPATDPDPAAAAPGAPHPDPEAVHAEIQAARAEAERLLEAARAKADALLAHAHRQAEEEAERARAAARRSEREAEELIRTARERAAEVERRERRLVERERRQTEEAARLAERERRLASAERELAEQGAALAKQQAALAEAERAQRAELERVAGLTAEAARAELVASIEAQAKREAAVIVRELEEQARRTGEERARHIVVEAIQRVASEQTSESVVSVLHLPSDEMKGRIIGREGRNIRAFESVTGVNLIVDDTPEAVLLSCFDPVRRETARVTLEKLVADGRIHPHRIEEVYEAARGEVEALCRRAAEDAMVEVGIIDLHDDLVTLLGRLRYRTSYGQNVLRHLVESALIAGLMATELGMSAEETQLVKRAAFLHDIGKALTHEAEGSHAQIGADLARRYGEHEEVVHAIEAHHNEVAPQTAVAVLTQAADACSGGRPGARREGLEAYVKRLQRIEQIAASKPGVEKVFAMQAGREVRVMVHPDQVDDIGAAVLARDVAKQIEEELTYPGQIRVTVIRELRATETAR
ncbi:MAG: ribonuclease Y [Micromonosporaceae bacterium]|jgi:ribonuclease Y